MSEFGYNPPNHMSPERWRQVEDVYHAARERGDGERAAFLAHACGADADLRNEVESLLDDDGSRAEIIERPAHLPATVGSQFGPYRIEASIGKGGMGEVWKARDPRLNRDVAIKISTQQFSGRFEREARAIAALNHSNICTLYDIGPNYLVMELIEGPTLAERIRRGPIPMAEALAIAKQIAGALEAAHEKGIVHRDLKPANIKLRPDGSVKVLDFGIAKVTRAESGAASDTMSVTTPVMIVGTPGYMSPEQLRGEKVDKRADIWTFGVVLFEMVSGQRPFEGKTVSDVQAAVIKEEPDWRRAPAKVRNLLRRCLEKEPKRRLRDIGDAMAMLDTEDVTSASSQSRFGKVGWTMVEVLALAAAALAVRTRYGPPPSGGQETRFTMELTPAEALGTSNARYRPLLTTMAFSPGSHTLVFSANNGTVTQLYKRPLDSSEATAMPGTEKAIYVFFSPDGEWIGFQAGTKLMKISVHGGPAIAICDLTGAIFGASWGWNNSIVFASPFGKSLMRVPASGGAPQVLIAADTAKGEVYSTPQWLADEKNVVFTVRTSDDWDSAHIVARQLDTGQQHDLIQGADARYIPTGHLLFLCGTRR